MDAGTMYANAKALHELLQEARSENAKLVMKLNAEHIVRQNVERENAKLRELVLDMWGFIEGTDEDCGDVTLSSCFDYCKHDKADDGCSKTGECWYGQRMRELGVDA